MGTMLVALAALSTPLASQGGGSAGGGRGGFTGGLAFTVGGGWQIEGLDVGYMRRVQGGPIAAFSLMGRVGSFVDEGAIVGGTRGFVFGVTLGTHTRALRLAELGADTSATRVGVDVTVETTGYAGSNSPLPVGSPWGAVSLLPGIRFGDQFGLLFGPTVFFGNVTQVRPFLGVRFEAALAR